ncbi:MAG: SAM-dependent methyltransferase [Vicinamibacterales bacterium]|jgi:SAM-dependent MidA family methyltransferase|nr:SAM-dependent methyltransferase [Vicinamibacterales bacterium]
MSLRTLIVQRIRNQGPLTTAAFMDLALYHQTLGYYTRARRRTGRAGDFYTSVDVGPQFGALLATQLDEMHRLLAATGCPAFDLVEVGAGNGQLGRDLLNAAESTYPALYAATRLTLVETSTAARAAQPATLGRHRARLAASLEAIPDQVCGTILANELLDALPTHAVTMTSEGLREIYIDLTGDRFVERLGPLSCPELADYLARLDVVLTPGWRGEVNLAAADWVRMAARRLQRGFLMLIDYGHTADELYSGRHDGSTLTTFHRHLVGSVGDDPFQRGGPAWLAQPGEQDITSHVDLTTVRAVAEEEGLDVLGLTDQSHFLLGLGALNEADSGTEPGGVEAVKHRLALKTLLVPGGLGSTHKVLLLGKQVGTPALRGCSFEARTVETRA